MARTPDGPRFETKRFASNWLREVAYAAHLEACLAKASEPTERERLVADLIAFSEGLSETAHSIARDLTHNERRGRAIHYLVLAHGSASIRTKWKRLRELSLQ
jgi:hypothetical protein